MRDNETDNDGIVTKAESPNFDNYKKIEGTAQGSSQVLGNPMTEHGSSRSFNIPQISEMSSEILTHPVRITVNGKERVCKNGILEGFKNAVKIIDSLAEKIQAIMEENKKLRDRLFHKNKEKSNGMKR